MENIVEKKDAPLIEAKHLKKNFDLSGKKKLHAIDDVSFFVNKGETLGLVGESGCGKSTVGNVVMSLLPATDGQLLYNGENVFTAEKSRKAYFQQQMQMVFQDPYSSLNPRKTIEKILEEAYVIHKKDYHDKPLKQYVSELCDMVEIPHSILDHYPHELDGGMRQVVGIARALSLKPKFVVCDEPVSSLDVSVQARIINLLIDLQKRDGYSYLFISHDLSAVRHISDRIAVMYLGQIVEMADEATLFSNTMHPYSIALLSAVPVIDTEHKVSRIILKGDVPSPVDPKPGCRFANRCWMAKSECFGEVDPVLREIEPGHFVACPFAEEAGKRALEAEKKSLKI